MWYDIKCSKISVTGSSEEAEKNTRNNNDQEFPNINERLPTLVQKV